MTDPDLPDTGRIFTIGHSNYPIEYFLALLAQHSIAVLVDVRSHAGSSYSPQFDGPQLKLALREAQIKYLFLGKELGGRPEGREFYDAQDHVLYSRVAVSPDFLRGIERLETGARTYPDRVAIMCSEENPAGCHRRLLVGRVLLERGVDVRHIRKDGLTMTEAELTAAEEPQLSLFDDQETGAWRSIRPVSRKKPPQSSLDD